MYYNFYIRALGLEITVFTVGSVAFLHEVVAAIVDQRAEVVTVARETCIARSTAVARTALPASAQDTH